MIALMIESEGPIGKHGYFTVANGVRPNDPRNTAPVAGGAAITSIPRHGRSVR